MSHAQSPDIVVNETTQLDSIPDFIPAGKEQLPLRGGLDAPFGLLRTAIQGADVAHSLAPADAYQIICDHKDVWLAQRNPVDGLFPGVIRNNGKIVQHPKWQALGVNALQAVKAIGTQIMLIHISMQLHDIQKNIGRIIEGMHDDRVGSLEGCLSTLAAAARFENDEARSREFERLAIPLQKGIAQNTRALAKEIEDCEVAEMGFLDHLKLWDRSLGRAERKMALAMDTASALFQSVAVLYYVYAYRNPPEHTAAAYAAREAINDIFSQVDLGGAFQKCGLVRGKERGAQALDFWKNLYVRNQEFCKIVSGEKELTMTVPSRILTAEKNHVL